MLCTFNSLQPKRLRIEKGERTGTAEEIFFIHIVQIEDNSLIIQSEARDFMKIFIVERYKKV